MNESMLTNFYIIMVYIRFDIKNKENKDIIYLLNQAVDGLINNKEMCEAIIRIMPDWKEQLKDEGSEYHFIHEKIIEFVKVAMYIMEDRLTMNEYDIAYDIADMLHVLPEIIIQNKKRRLKRYWQVYVENFHKKWNCDDFTKFKRYFI